MLVESLEYYLSNNAGVQGQLGTPSQRTDKTTGIFPTMAPQAVPVPYLVMQQVGGQPGAISYAGTNRLQEARWRFSCYGSTYKQAKLLARAVKSALNSLYGNIVTGHCEVQGSWLKLEADESEALAKGTLYATHVDYGFEFLDNDPQA